MCGNHWFVTSAAVCSRWKDTSNPTALHVPDLSKCPDYNMWHYGFGGRFTPFVVNSLASHGGENAMFRAYASRDVVYLMGQNDTCNEYLTPHCQSHGLDKSCAGMLEGHFRRERAENYIRFLAEFFGRPVHKGSLVPVRLRLLQETSWVTSTIISPFCSLGCQRSWRVAFVFVFATTLGLLVSFVRLSTSTAFP